MIPSLKLALMLIVSYMIGLLIATSAFGAAIQDGAAIRGSSAAKVSAVLAAEQLPSAAGALDTDPQESSTNPVGQPHWKLNPIEKKKGWDTCKKCHDQQIEVLTSTVHFTSFETMHRTPAAKQYCKALGLRSVKRSERCVKCHYSPELSPAGKIKSASGISCENCHGASADWFLMHNDYGGQLATKETESAKHRQWRVAKGIELGLRHPSNLYLLARSCYECHLIDDAELVNKTAHTAVTEGFNMLAWSQGKMRHNFLRTEGKSNAESEPARRRVMYVTDLMTHIEFGLRALAKSKSGSRHATAIKKSVGETIAKLRKVNAKINNKWIARADAIINGMVTENAPPETLLKAAEQLSQNSFEFGMVATMTGEGHALGAIDEMLPTPAEYIR